MSELNNIREFVASSVGLLGGEFPSPVFRLLYREAMLRDGEAAYILLTAEGDDSAFRGLPRYRGMRLARRLSDAFDQFQDDLYRVVVRRRAATCFPSDIGVVTLGTPHGVIEMTPTQATFLEDISYVSANSFEKLRSSLGAELEYSYEDESDIDGGNE